MPGLVVLTTSDADPGVMRDFAEALAKMSRQKIKVLWRVVDGLQAYQALPPDVAEAAQDMELAWHDPGRHLSQAEAVFCGLRLSRGARVLLMTPDMIGNVDDIPRFAERLDAGYDVVAGWRASRSGVPAIRRGLTRIFNAMAMWLFRLPIQDFNTCMGGLSSQAVLSLIDPPPGCPSPALNTACRFRESMCEIPISVAEIAGRQSAYTVRSRVAVGVMKLKEMLRFFFWRRSRGGV